MTDSDDNECTNECDYNSNREGFTEGSAREWRSEVGGVTQNGSCVAPKNAPRSGSEQMALALTLVLRKRWALAVPRAHRSPTTPANPIFACSNRVFAIVSKPCCPIPYRQTPLSSPLSASLQVLKYRRHRWSSSLGFSHTCTPKSCFLARMPQCPQVLGLQILLLI